jgi:TRAP-type C4-dicarboxylate transport system permease small subunit
VLRPEFHRPKHSLEIAMKKHSIKSILKNLDLIIAGIAFVIIVIVTFGGVVMRYVFNNPIIWQEEIQVSLFVWVVFFGGSAAFRTHGHVEIAMVYDAVPQKGKKVLSVLIFVCVILTLSYFCVKSFELVKMFHTSNKSTSVLSIRSDVLYSIVPVCCILMIIRYVIASIQEFKELFSEEPKEKEMTV